MKKKIELIMGFTLIVAAFLVTKYGGETIQSVINMQKKDDGKIVVVIDAGHGGEDSGKKGINGCLEKDVNLSVAIKLKELLEKSDINVIMTRSDKNGLYDEKSNNKKVEDLKKRVEIISKSKADFAISIHQNSYSQESVSGPQVFYHAKSKEGKELAQILQEELISQLEPQNERQIKSNESYYILKETEIPTVIVECGFLSNQNEAELLITDEYQMKVANAIYEGIEKFI